MTFSIFSKPRPKSRYEGPRDYEERRELAVEILVDLRDILSGHYERLDIVPVETDGWMGNPELRYELRDPSRKSSGAKKFLGIDEALLVRAPITITEKQKIVIQRDEQIIRPIAERLFNERYSFIGLKTSLWKYF